MEPTLRRHQELIDKGELTDDERAELRELNVAMARSKGTPSPQAPARPGDRSAINILAGCDPFGPNFALFSEAKLVRKSLTGWRFSLCQATVICVECAPFPASHLVHAVGDPTVPYRNTPQASDTHDTKAQAPCCSCLQEARQDDGKPAAAAHSSKGKAAHPAKAPRNTSR